MALLDSHDLDALAFGLPIHPELDAAERVYRTARARLDHQGALFFAGGWLLCKVGERFDDLAARLTERCRAAELVRRCKEEQCE